MCRLVLIGTTEERWVWYVRPTSGNRKGMIMSERRLREIELRLDDIEREHEAYSKAIDELRISSTQLTRETEQLTNERAKLVFPWEVGSIVEDETGVRFRITDLGLHGYRRDRTPNGEHRPQGIRLAKNGAEAYRDPRRIYSNWLKVVDPETD